MLKSRLGQTLIINPDVSFFDIEKVMEELGWRKEPNHLNTDPIIQGEPEVASWTNAGRKPFVIYTFNPVISLRVLDVATLPPVHREAIVNRIPVLSEQAVGDLLQSDLAQRQLLGLWSAQETERIDLIEPIQKLVHDNEKVVSKQAEKISLYLQNITEARLQTMGHLQLLVQAAPTLVRKLSDDKFIQQLKPDLAACKLLFDESIAENVSILCEDIYTHKPLLRRLSHEADVIATAAPAGLLRWSNELSDKFPGGYRDIAGWMQPEKIWMTWKTIEPNGSTVRYDGLVWLGDRWVWLPKIFRKLAQMCVSGDIYVPHTIH